MTTASELSARLADLLRNEHRALAEFLVALAAFDEAKAWSDLGHRSLFDYLHRRLGLSKGAAFYRMTAAQLIQRHPEVTEPLRSGALCLLWNDRSTTQDVLSFRPDQAALEMAQLDD